jgi:hypothetical protein
MFNILLRNKGVLMINFSNNVLSNSVLNEIDKYIGILVV